MTSPPPPVSAIPIDRSYAWVVCFGTFVLNFVVQGMYKSMGILLVEFREFFDEGQALGSLTMALVAAGFFLFAGLANALGAVFSNRAVVFTGAVMSGISMVATSFMPSMISVVFVLGIVTGIAYGAIFGPSLVTVNQYFSKRRALACGLAVAGGSVGQLTIPFLVVALIEHYAFRGGILIMGGVVLHAIPASMLLRPLTYWNTATKLKQLRLQREEDKFKTIMLPIGSTPQVPNPTDTKSQNTDTKATPQAETPQQARPGPCTLIGMICSSLFNKQLAKNIIFVTVIIGLTFAHGGYLSAVIFLPSYIVQLWQSKQTSALFVSIMGGCDLFGRLFGGWFADLRIVQISDIMMVSLSIPGVVGVVMLLFPMYAVVMVFTVLLGALAGAYTALVVPILADYFGPAKVPSGFGMACLAMGTVMIPLPLILGSAAQSAGSFKIALVVPSVMLILAGVTFGLMRGVRKIVAARGGSPTSDIVDIKVVEGNEKFQNGRPPVAISDISTKL